MKEKEWSPEEFEILLQNPQLSDEELSSQLPCRSPGAIGVVRAFIHNFHMGGNVSGLSRMMIRHLEQGSWNCPLCPYKKGEADMQICIHTHDTRLVFKLLGKSQACAGDVIDVGQGVSLTYDGTYGRKALGFPEIIMLSASFPSGVAAGLLANWLWEKLRGQGITQIEIDRTIVEFNEGEIKRVIREKTRESRK